MSTLLHHTLPPVGCFGECCGSWSSGNPSKCHSALGFNEKVFILLFWEFFELMLRGGVGVRLWLLDILACPADGCKHYPLKLSIFEWEGDDASRILKARESYAKGNVENVKRELKDSVKIDRDKGIVEDELVRSPMKVEDYVTAFKEKVDSIFKNVVVDETGASIQLLKAILDFKPPSVLDESFEKAIYITNWLAFKVNVQSGILVCDNCGRFYPILETIPHMLPDDLRNKKEDREFLLKWRKFIPKKILEAEGVA
ncbi:MAG: hypothetical protein KIH01_00325 [Candidatus Freyarchaeota archaeon]|nr:hypothetical protein [Candidatus Jordarchaeia archaeon]